MKNFCLLSAVFIIFLMNMKKKNNKFLSARPMGLACWHQIFNLIQRKTKKNTHNDKHIYVLFMIWVLPLAIFTFHCNGNIFECKD